MKGRAALLRCHYPVIPPPAAYSVYPVMQGARSAYRFIQNKIISVELNRYAVAGLRSSS
jgi:hypothetical protein